MKYCGLSDVSKSGRRKGGFKKRSMRAANRNKICATFVTSWIKITRSDPS